jgi:hypothetical protein
MLYNIRCGGILLGRPKGGETKLRACAFVRCFGRLPGLVILKNFDTRYPAVRAPWPDIL